jgi:hypothetical protein
MNEPNAASPPGPRLSWKPGLVETDLGNELVLLDPETRQMYSLNAVGRLIWQTLPGRGLDAAIEEITRQFEVSAPVARTDAEDLVAQLTTAGLLRPAPEGTPGHA